MTSHIQMYGIKNCDSVKKSIKWLNEKQVICEFHDFKKEIPNQELIIKWLEDIGQEKLINKRGLTWRKLSDEEKVLTDRNAIINLIQSNTSVVKRPVIFNGQFWSVGFKAEDWDKLFL